MEKFDCVVVGAGWAGLAAAKQYRFLNPESSLVILESARTLGGVWGDDRLYPGLNSNNLLGTFEYPDFPMSPDVFDVKPGEYVKGQSVNAYLKACAAKFGIDKLIRVKTKLLVAEHHDTEGGWTLTVLSEGQGESKIFGRRLIMATGVSSEAFLPHFEGQETFGGKIFHGKHFLQNKDTIREGGTVTIFGGSKLPWDAAYTYAKAGVKVNWVIRPSGHGPCWMSSSYVTPFKQWIEALANIRFLTWFSPCVWGNADGYDGIRRFLHGSHVGRAIVSGFWSVMGKDTLALTGYDSHPETAKLKPWTKIMYTGASYGILNYDSDFFDLVKDGSIKIHTADIDHLSPGTVHLSDGTALASDALLAHTGWKHVPLVKFLPEGIENEIGIPHEPVQKPSEDDLASQSSIMDKADEEILRLFPILKDQPVWNKDYVPLLEQKGITSTDPTAPSGSRTPYMLHRFMIPTSERLLRTRDIAFLGLPNNFSNMISAHIGGLWIAAYFSGRLSVDPGAAVGSPEAMDKLRYETMLHNRYGHWRYPTDWGNKTPSFIFDAVPYLDLMQRDLGLAPHRKGSFWKEMVQAYAPPDYKDVNEEWMKTQR